MAFSEFERARIRVMVGALVDRRQPPPELRDQLRYELEIDGHRVRVWEVRPGWHDPTTTTRTGVAQFTYTRTRDEWKLYWMRADEKWHALDPPNNTGRLEALVRVVADDRYGAFWG